MNDARAAAGLWKRPGVAGALLVAVLVLALALRLKGVGWGLPFSFVNADESVVVSKAFDVARGGLNPQFFYYPSLFFYLAGGVYLLAAPVLWAVQHANPLAMGTFVVHPGPYFLLARLLSVAAGTASVYLLYRIGREAFARPAGLVAALFLAVAPLHVAYSHMAVTDVTATALSLLALLLLLQAARGGGRRRLIAGAVAAGLATSTKYNLGGLVLPATIAAAYVCRGEVGRRVAAGGRAALLWPRLLLARVYAPMLLAFLVGSPFVVLDPGHFLHDFLRQNRIMDRGWLGFENVGNGFWYNLETNLGGTLGVVLVVLAIAGLAWALWRHTTVDLLLAPYALAYFVYISTWKELADRYLLPILPLLLLFAVRMCLDLVDLRPAGRRVAVPLVALVLAAALVAPLAGSIAFDRGLSGADVRVRAKAWVERHVPAGSIIATESYGPPLVRVRDEKYYRSAGLETPAYRLLRLRLPAPGVPNRSHNLDWLRQKDADYVIVSSKVYDRVLAAADAYPELAAFYRSLDKDAELVEVFTPGPGERGPVLKLYRLAAPSPPG
ncbi:MAG: glycosyltransferase family 39 protein [Actinobacteria bacterium]|nr:glycosyltransferase family 39 protein [Actinomycetota bacterium]